MLNLDTHPPPRDILIPLSSTLLISFTPLRPSLVEPLLHPKPSRIPSGIASSW